MNALGTVCWGFWQVWVLRREALLPAPYRGFVLADCLGDGVGALAIRRQQDNPGAPDVLLRAIAIPCDRLQSHPISRCDRDGYSLPHCAHSHKTTPRRILFGRLLLGAIH